MRKILLIILGVSLGLGATVYGAVTNPFRTFEGGTGTTTPSGILYGDNGSINTLHTVSVGSGCTFISGTLSCAGTSTGGGTAFWTRFNNSGLYPATSTDQVEIGGTSTSSTATLDIEPQSGIPPLSIGSSSPYFYITSSGKSGFNNTSPSSLVEIGTNTYMGTGLTVHGGDGGSGTTIMNVKEYGGTPVLSIAGNGTMTLGGTGTITGLSTLTVSTTTGGVINIGTGAAAGSTASPLLSTLNFLGYANTVNGAIAVQDKSNSQTGGWMEFNILNSSGSLQNAAIIDNHGSLGVGTLTPTATLSVQGTGSTNPFAISSSTGSSMLTVDPAGDVTLGTLGSRIEGDFSNSTIANRVAFQTSTTNGNTNVTVLPNGTSATSAFNLYGNSSPTNAEYLNIGMNSSGFGDVGMGVRGSGIYSNMLLQNGGATAITIDPSQNIDIATLTPATLVMNNSSGQLQSVTLGSNLSFSGTTLNAGSSATLTGGTTGYDANWTSSTTLSSGVVLDNGIVAGINATSSTINFNVQGTGSNAPFQVASSSGGSLIYTRGDGTTGLNTTGYNSNGGLWGSPVDVLALAAPAGKYSAYWPSISLESPNNGAGAAIEFLNHSGGGGADFGYVEGGEIGFANRASGEPVNFYTAGPTKQLAILPTYSTFINSLGVGGVTSPGSELVVQGSGATSGNSAANITNSNTTSLLYVRDDGNIGIGNTNPSYALDVYADSSNSSVVERLYGQGGSSSDNVQLRFAGQKDGELWALGSDISGGGSTGDFEFYNLGNAGGSAGTKVTILGNGNVGIGSTTPTAKFSIDVASSTAGTAQATPFGSLMSMIINGVRYMTESFDYYGHRYTQGPVPVISSCGTSPSIVGNDSDMVVTVGSVSASGCTITFANPYITSPRVNVTNRSMSVVNAMTYTVSSTQIVVSQIGLTGDVIDISVEGMK